MANDLNQLKDLDGTGGGPPPAQGRELVIVDLGHAAIMAGASGRRPGRDSIYL
ncbi:MAG TPA: hypothetical protein VND02_06015 [Actinomycetota bacterium]|nr:hypothetical protein [Actinomycetota bacterium]